MKKRYLLILLAIILGTTAAGHAEKGLSCSFAPDSPETVLAQQIAGLLGLQLLPVPDDGEEPAGSAANLMFADPECVLIGSQDVLIAGLQGYTVHTSSEELWKALCPICSLAESPLFLVMDRDVASGLGITDFASLREYTFANEYELTFARHIGADPVDRAVVQLSEDLEIMIDVFSDEEIPDVLHAGDEAAAGVFCSTELTASEDDWLILCCLGSERCPLWADVPCASEVGLTPCEGTLLCLFMSAEADNAAVSSVSEAAAMLKDESMPAGYVPRYSSGDGFTDVLKAMFNDYKQYMTSEGKMFYEE